MITFNGVSSDTFSALVFRIETDTAPVEELEVFEVPGRSGDLLVSNHRFPNVENRYRAVFYGENAMSNYVDFKNYLLSQHGYQRLEDDDHPDEFYMARVSKDIEPTMVKERDKVKCEIVFSRKPQRYLKSGETHYSWVPDSNTVSGQSLLVYTDYLDPETRSFATERSHKTDAEYTVPEAFDQLGSVKVLIDNTVAYNAALEAGAYSAEIDLYTGDVEVTEAYFGLTEQIDWVRLWRHEDGTITDTKISDFTDRPINKSATAILANAAHPSGTTLTVGAITACSHFNVVSNPATAQKYCVYSDTDGYLYFEAPTLMSPAFFKTWLPNVTDNRLDIAFETSYTYDLASVWDEDFPVGIHQIDLATTPSVNAEIEFKYETVGYSINNPSPFTSKPLIRIYGNGTFQLNDITVTVQDSTSYVDVDCDLMDCYTGTSNRNNDVSFSTYDFPELKVGENSVSIGNGIAMVEIVPRWWRL